MLDDHRQEVADLAIRQQVDQRSLHLAVGDVKGPQFVPSRRVVPEIRRGRLRALRLDRAEPAPVGDQVGIVIGDEVDQCPRQAGTGPLLRQTEIGERTFAEPVKQAGLGQQAQVPGHAGLALSEDRREIADRELPLSTQGQEPEAGRLGRRLQAMQQLFHSLPIDPLFGHGHPASL